MNIYLGADHRGFELKEKVKIFLAEINYKFIDKGAYVHDPNDDYTTFASKVALSVSEKSDNKGILMCGSGAGIEVVANKFDGARASLGKEVKQVEAGREDDDINILVIAADFTTGEEAKNMIRKFLNTKYVKNERHERRLRDIEKIESIN